MHDESQTSDTVLLVRPASFAFHAEAAASNAFAGASDLPDIAGRARTEFEALRSKLEAEGVDCLILEDCRDPPKPDAVFPNNWVSFHSDGTIIAYPMANEARRPERRLDDLSAIIAKAGRTVFRVTDLSPLEDQGIFIEGTGSLIFDRPRRRAFACRSPRTTERGLSVFEQSTGWTVERFDATDRHGRQIYHTNVMLSLGSLFALVCAEAIAPPDRERVLSLLAEDREVVEVDFNQMERFACNAIELRDRSGAPLIALSRAARGSLLPTQRVRLEQLGGRLVAVDIPTIEQVGGGSVRCMIADVHVPRRA